MSVLLYNNMSSIVYITIDANQCRNTTFNGKLGKKTAATRIQRLHGVEKALCHLTTVYDKLRMVEMITNPAARSCY